MAAVENLVAWAGIAAEQQRDQFIRAGPANNATWVEPVELAERFSQLQGVPVRVAMDVASQSAVSGDRFGTWSQGAFVGSEADRPFDAPDLSLAANIRRNIKDA